jgi:glucose/arabinose dehydrogenase
VVLDNTVPSSSSNLYTVYGGGPAGEAIDSAGNIYIAENDAGTVVVIPSESGTLFGQSVTAGIPATLITGLDHPTGLAVDTQGDLYVTTFGSGTVTVLPVATGTLFGLPVSANTPAVLVSSGLLGPTGIAFDAAGNLYVSDTGGSTVDVLPLESGTIFGSQVTADQLNTLVLYTEADNPTGLAFDSEGNLYFANYSSGTIAVLPQSSGSIFGEQVTAGSVSTLLGGLSSPCGIAFDSMGDLFVANLGTSSIGVLPAFSGEIYSYPVIWNSYSSIISSGPNNPEGLALDWANDLYFANNGSGSVTEES